MKYNKIETLVGLIVLMIAGAFLLFAYNVNNSGVGSDGYKLVAHFQNIDGIEKGSDVKISGIKIGFVEEIVLMKDTYDAILTLNINKDIEIPKDSTAMVATSGLLGGRYIRIIPGGGEDNLADGQKITMTQSALNIEDLISKFIYTMSSK